MQYKLTTCKGLALPYCTTLTRRDTPKTVNNKMLYTQKTIQLPQNDLGQYLITKEALQIIKKANALVARWSNSTPGNCFFRACVEKVFEGDKISIHYDMPINIRSNNAKNAFISHFSIYEWKGTPAFIECLKEGSILFFGGDTGGSTNTDNAGLAWDYVNYTIINGKKFIYGQFDQSITPLHSSARLLWDGNE